MKVLRKLFATTLSLSLILGSVGMAFASNTCVTSMNDIPQVLAQEMNNRETSITINYTGPDVQKIASYSISTLLASAYKTTADDYLRWNWTKFSYTATSSASNKLQIVATAGYYTTKAQEDKVDTKVDEVLDTIIKIGMSDFDKVKAINQWVIDNVSYDNTLTKRSAYNGFFDHSAVCQGYTLMIDKLCEEAGISTKIVAGTLNGDTHGWNMVNVGGTWYQLDATNNDTNNNMFFLVSDSFLKKYGYAWTQSSYPACNEVYDKEAEAELNATYTVLKAEESLSQKDYDAAVALVSALKESDHKAILNSRLVNVITQIKLNHNTVATPANQSESSEQEEHPQSELLLSQ